VRLKGTVAIIGADGAGKTTISNRLLASFPLPLKYLYMGMNPQSSNFALPTSRLLHKLKIYKYQKQFNTSNNGEPKIISLHTIEHRQDRRGKLAAAARLLNRLAEATFRQFVSWTYQLRGYIVLYDRHFLFDFSWSNSDAAQRSQRVSGRIYLWFLNHVYPKPDLVIFLDAPPEVLITRKDEVPLEYLEARREAFMDKGEQISEFVRVDANRPVDVVYAEVSNHILQFFAKGLSTDGLTNTDWTDQRREPEPKTGYSEVISKQQKEISL
jgi:thymidylate kinase